MSRYYIALERVEKAVIAVRVSGGHLCKAEAPTEPTGETAVRRAAIVFPHPLPLRSRVNGCGNPFFFLRVLRILSRLPLLRCPKVVIRLEREQLLTAAPAVACFILHRSESNVTQNDNNEKA